MDAASVKDLVTARIELVPSHDQDHAMSAALKAKEWKRLIDFPEIEDRMWSIAEDGLYPQPVSGLTYYFSEVDDLPWPLDLYPGWKSAFASEAYVRIAGRHHPNVDTEDLITLSTERFCSVLVVPESYMVTL
mgnify:FL=1